MSEEPLVSIIIPTYNRAHLIGETLDSVLAQTYQNWECIVVDDGSTDETDEVMKSYCEKDLRFVYKHRSAERPKGANACRNLGLDVANGDYIIFFDSDDLMTKGHVEEKLKPLLNGKYDYSIAKTKYFNVKDESLERYYKFDQYEITPHNYIVQNINWLTLDVCIKSTLAKEVHFNQNLQSGQEFNYFSKLILKSNKCIFIPKYLSLRRKHDNSTQANLKTQNIKWRRSFKSMWLTYLDIKEDIVVITKKILLYKCIKNIYREKEFFAEDRSLFLKEIYNVFGIAGVINFWMMFYLRKFFNKGYSFRQKFKA